MFLSKILIHSCMIIHCIVKEKILLLLFRSFSTEDISKRQIKECFKINDKQRIIMTKKGEYVKFKNYEIKIKSPFMIYADFGSMLVPENNGKRNPKESQTNIYEKHIDHNYSYKLACVDDKVSVNDKS